MLARLISYWVYGGLLAGLLLLVLSPLLLAGWPGPLAAAFFLLPTLGVSFLWLVFLYRRFCRRIG